MLYFPAATPGIKVERIKVIVKCPSQPPTSAGWWKERAPKPCLAFIVIIHTLSIDYGMHWLRWWGAAVGAAHMRVRVCDCAFRRVYSLAASLHQLCAVLMEMSPTAVAAETRRRYHRSQKGGKPNWSVEWTLFRSFVYVRSGSRVLGERRSLGMLGLLTCTVQWGLGFAVQLKSSTEITEVMYMSKQLCKNWFNKIS